ncbi:hypothetical protein V8J82_03405 [Gymnodinialimonas sp. 2305UL16-5]|uniref:hypothetical protein n=1 Tax=Gymnodinialimonas mytili TaxID=3126503 RepID=UPI0030AC12C7
MSWKLAGAAMVMLGATPVAAQSWAAGAPDILRFEQCLPEQMAAFEARLSALPGYGVTVPMDAFNVHWVQHCGYLAIGICDVSAETFTCQRRMREVWLARAAELRAALPAPDSVTGDLAPLYAQVYVLSEGSNAGDDCDGQSARAVTWCQAFQAVLKFEQSVWAWQVGRLAGVTGPLDWADWAELER